MLVLDANILIRAVLGARVLVLLRRYAEQAKFFAPDVAFQEARKHLPAILNRRGMSVAPSIEILDSLTKVVQAVELETYAPFESLARQRLVRRTEDDWPVLASALALNCPIWTEDATSLAVVWRPGQLTVLSCSWLKIPGAADSLSAGLSANCPNLVNSVARAAR